MTHSEPDTDPTATNPGTSIPGGPGECTYPNDCLVDTRRGLTSNCPEHGQVPVMTGRQWGLLNAVTDTSPNQLWHAMQPFLGHTWTRGDVRPIYIVGEGIHWAIAILTPLEQHLAELTFVTAPCGWCRLELPIRYEREALAALWRTLRTTAR